MAHIHFDPQLLSTLKDKVVVLTGGATGIGRSAVKLLHGNGAKVVFGDVNTSSGEALQQELSSPDVTFTHCDVTSYSSQLAMFKEAERKYGKIDVVVANSGISIPKDQFDFSSPSFTEADIEREMTTAEIDVNLKGALYTSRLGLWFLQKEKDGRKGGDLVLVSSIAGFKESTGMTVYTASKHGVLGILRGVRVQAQRMGVRVNAVCPWMTKTGMVRGIESGWASLSLPENSPESVAKSILICATAGRSKDGKDHEGAKDDFWGKVLFVAGGESYEIEDRLWELEPLWLGQENAKVVEKGQKFLMDEGTSWDTEKSRQ